MLREIGNGTSQKEYYFNPEGSFSFCILATSNRSFFPAHVAISCDLALATESNAWNMITADEVECPNCVKRARDFESELPEQNGSN